MPALPSLLALVLTADASDAPPVPDVEEAPPTSAARLPTPAPAPAPLPAPVSVAPKPTETVTIDGEYRLRHVYVNPLELAGERVREVMWAEQRLRTDVAIRAPAVFTLRVQADVLAGVLYGDNGTYGGSPGVNSGVSLATKRPNNAGWNVGLGAGLDPLDPNSYAPKLTPLEPLLFNHVYVDAKLPFGLLRVGRQPIVNGANLSAHEGSAINRWGVSRYADSVDRVLVATKLDEAVKVALGGGPPNLSEDDGLIFALFHDWLGQHDVADPGDDTRQLGAALLFRKPAIEVGPLLVEKLVAGANVVHLSDDRFDSDVWGLPLKFEGRSGRVAWALQYMLIRGESREVSEGFAALTSRPAAMQEIKGDGAQAVIDVTFGPVTLTMEGDYASGDDDPTPTTPITSFAFARDLNVGLLLFEHVLAFQSARSAAVGIQNLAKLDAPSFPITEAQTDGRFTNAIALFPQAKVQLLDSARHKLHARGGVLFAWPAADGGVVDPIRTALATDGQSVKDDRVNYMGGDPGTYYGTEFDVQVEWLYEEAMSATIESAFLLPGDALENEHGLAVPSFLTEARLGFRF